MQDFSLRHEDFYWGWVERKCQGFNQKDLSKENAQTNSSSIASFCQSEGRRVQN